jgi:transposase InsO family protein
LSQLGRHIKNSAKERHNIRRMDRLLGNTKLHEDIHLFYKVQAKHYQALPAEKDLVCSMSGKGNCFDNAVAESFFHSLKTELTYHQHYKTRQEAKQSIFKYLEVFYNRQRLHSYYQYLAPIQFEEKYA